MLRHMLLTVVLVALSGIIPVAAGPAASYEEARQVAAATGKPIVIDFFTTWCTPCLAFEKATKEDAQIIAALDDIVLLTVDAWESKEGHALASRYRVRGYPSFIVVDAEGFEKNRWGGYATPESWLESLNSILDAESGIADLQREYEAHPQAEAAEELLQYYRRSNAPLQAVQICKDLLSMRPENAATYKWTIFEALVESYGIEHEESDRLRVAYDDALALELSPHQWARLAVLIKPVAWQVNDPGWYASAIPLALAQIQDSDERYVVWARGALSADALIYVDKNPNEALAQKRSKLDAEWQNSVRDCMSFGTWCQENRINMVEAQQALETVLGRDNQDEDTFLLGLAWSTLGDLRATQGEYDAAVTAINQAIDYIPGVPELYAVQRRYELLASQSANRR